MANNTRMRAGLALLATLAIATLAIAACGSSALATPAGTAPATAAPAASSAPVASTSGKGNGGYDYGVGNVDAAASVAPAATQAAPAATQAVAAGGATTLAIANFAFDPGSVKVKVGTAVTWTNSDGAPHTVTAADGSFASGRLGSGAAFSFTFATAGTYVYHCAIHSSMTGTITVSS